MNFLATLIARGEGSLPVLERRPRALFEPAPAQRQAGAPREDDGFDAGYLGAASRSAPPHPLAAESDRQDARSAGAFEGSAAAGSLEARALAGGASIASQPTARFPERPGTDDGASAVPPPGAGAASLVPTAAADGHGEAADPHRPASGGDGRPLLLRPHAGGPMPREAMGPLDRTKALATAPTSQPIAHQSEEALGGDAMAMSPSKRRPHAGKAEAGLLQARPLPPQTSAALLAKTQPARAPVPNPEGLRAPLAAPSAPPVHISIGRVEIRAVPNAANKAHAVGPAAPRLSLDDYLRSRNGGRR